MYIHEAMLFYGFLRLAKELAVNKNAFPRIRYNPIVSISNYVVP
jgi:hypothetical protein